MHVLATFAAKVAAGLVATLVVLGGVSVFSIQTLARSAVGREAVVRQYVENVALADSLEVLR
jgi:hypothetical protein